MQNNITDEKYHGLSDDAYNISGGIIKDGEMTSDQKFRVLAVENNKNNGMQSMAVAPVDSNGEVDTSKIVISYAGTDFNDQLDVATDIQQVVFGEKYRLTALKEYRRATQRES